MHLNRWTRTTQDTGPDFVLHFGYDLKYQSFQRLRPVPHLLHDPEAVIGKHICEVAGKHLTNQFVQAAQRAISLREPVSFQYTIKLRGQSWLSEARVMVHQTEKRFIVEVTRLQQMPLVVQRA